MENEDNASPNLATYTYIYCYSLLLLHSVDIRCILIKQVSVKLLKHDINSEAVMIKKKKDSLTGLQILSANCKLQTRKG